MARLEDFTRNVSVRGILPNGPVVVVDVRWIGSSTVELTCKVAADNLGHDLHYRDDFEGKFRDGVHHVDVTDLMRRLVKERLLKIDGTLLFPERIANSVIYELSDKAEAPA